jgi:hypothetical protein
MSLIRPADRLRARVSKARLPHCPWVAAGGREQPGAPGSGQTPAAAAARPAEAGDADPARGTGAEAHAKPDAKGNEGGV